jgi:hypothetical protein
MLAAVSMGSAVGAAQSRPIAEQTTRIDSFAAATTAPALQAPPAVAVEQPRSAGVAPAAEKAAAIAAMPNGEARPDPSCRLGAPHLPRGTSSVVATGYEAGAAANVVRLRIEIEDGVAVDPECFAETVASILNDPRGWGAGGQLAFQPVTDDDPDLRLVLASPGMADRLCFPLRTGGKYSCRNHDTVVLNLARWESGTEEYAGNLEIYRQYLVNHEVGHYLGHGHTSCPGTEEPAPVMMQQTKGLGECSLNGWPTSDER